jgi:hypothetical protein
MQAYLTTEQVEKNLLPFSKETKLFLFIIIYLILLVFYTARFLGVKQMGRHECKKSNKHLEHTMIMMAGSKYMSSRAVAFEN